MANNAVPTSVVERFGEWVRALTYAELFHLMQLAEQEPQERWVEHYRAIALARQRVMRAGFRALFAGVRGSVGRLATVRVSPRVEPVEIDPVTGRPYGEILWEPVRPAFGGRQLVIYRPPREPRPPYPGYPLGVRQIVVSPIVVPPTEQVGEVVLVSRGVVK